jgi:PAS domain S-box-containing protein
MANKTYCWELFNCSEKNCPVFIEKELRCWMVSGTRCREEIQGLFLEKMEMCLECGFFKQTIDPADLQETLKIVSLQFKEATRALRDRDRALKEINLDLGLGLSQSVEMVRKLCLGDPTARVKIDSPNEMLVKLGGGLNQMGESVQEMVDQSQELAKGLSQHYDTLNRIAGGDLTVTANEDSNNELISKLGQLINKETRTLMKVIGEYRKAEVDLQEKEERYRLLFEQAPVGVFHYDHQLRITDCNDRFVEILRSHREKLLNLDMKNLKDHSVLPAIEKALGGTPGYYEGPYSATTSSAVILISMQTAPLWSREGKIRGGMGIVEEISERKMAEEELAAEKERLAVTLRSIGDGVITTDMEGRVVLLNQAAESQTGWSQEEARGRSLQEVFFIVDEKTRDRCLNPVDKVLLSGRTEILAAPTVLINRDGRERIIADSGAPIRDSNGKMIGVVLVFRDITNEQRLADELLNYEKLKSIGVLAGGIAHDFNNILTGIMGNISLAKMFAQDAEKVRKRLDEAEKASYLARELTQQLLTFSRGGAPVKTTASMAEYVQEAVNFALRGSKLKAEFLIPADIWPVDFDQGQFQQVIHNLVINADQAMPEGGVLQVGMDNRTVTAGEGISLPEGRYVRIWFADQGIGIPQEDLSRVFDPFFTTKPGASGLGLSTVYSIIKRHDGLMTADSPPGKGATFCLTLPASGKTPPVQEEAASSWVKGQGRILVMDDEPIVREVLGEMLARLGFEVQYAQDGAEAVKIYRVAKKIDQPFDLLIMDLTVAGGMGGLEALQKLLEFDPEVRAIASSGYSSDPVMSEFQAYGFKGVMAKPYTLEELSQVLGSLPTP